MRDIAIYKTIHYSKDDGACLQQYVIDNEEHDLYLLDLHAFGAFEFRKYMDGDQLTLQLSGGFLDRLCEAWVSHRQNDEKLPNEAKVNQSE